MLHLLLADLPLSAPAFGRLLIEPGLPAAAALCRQAVVLEQEAPREDAQAAWLTPSERWLLHALRLDGTDTVAESVASDVGISGGAASAEEAAMHIIDDYEDDDDDN